MSAADPGTPLPAENRGGGGVALCCAEARALLSPYTDGVLTAERAGAVEAHLAQCAGCRQELKALKTEAALITEALTDLKPSDSYRGRVAQMCAEVREKAARMAASLPERGWAFFRWGFAFIAVALFTATWITRGLPQRPDYEPAVEAFLRAASPLFWVNAATFAVAVFLLVEGRAIAWLEYYLSRRFGGGETVAQPSRLEVVGLEMVGLLGVLVTGVFHAFFLAA